MFKLNVIIEKSKDGYFAYCPELKGCFTQGESLDEVKLNINDAIQLYLSTLDEEEISALKQKETLSYLMNVEYV